MTNWKYDLSKTTDTVVRLGIHGLARLLREEGSARYPGVVQTPTLSWTMDDQSIDLRFETYADLQPLISGMLGDFREGFAAMPAYPTAREAGRYATIMAHTAIESHIFCGAQSGPKRGLSLLDKKRRDLFLAQHPDQPLMDKVDDIPSGSGAVVLKFSPFTNDWPARPVWDSPESEQAYADLERQVADASKQEAKRLKKEQTVFRKKHCLIQPHTPLSLGEMPNPKKKTKNSSQPPLPTNGSLHPQFFKWNDVSSSLPPSDWFAAAFSCLSYIYLRHRGGHMGVGVDGATFAEAIDLHNTHLTFTGGRNYVRGVLLWSDADAVATARTLLNNLGASAGVYSIVLKESSSSYDCDPQTFLLNYSPEHSFPTVTSMFLSARDKDGLLVQARSCPVRMGRRNGYRVVYSDLLSVLLRNLDMGRPWFCGLEDIANHGDLDEWVRFYGGRLHQVASQMQSVYSTHPQLAEFRQRHPEHPVYDIIRDIGAQLVQRLAKQYLDKIAPGSSKDNPASTKDLNWAYSKARDVVLKHNLRRARGPQAVRTQVADLFTLADFRMISEEETRAFGEMFDKNPMHLRSLLIVGAVSRRLKSKDDDAQPEPESSESGSDPDSEVEDAA